MTMMIIMSRITRPPMAAPIMIVMSFFLTSRVLSVAPEDINLVRSSLVLHTHINCITLLSYCYWCALIFFKFRIADTCV